MRRQTAKRSSSGDVFLIVVLSLSLLIGLNFDRVQHWWTDLDIRLPQRTERERFADRLLRSDLLSKEQRVAWDSAHRYARLAAPEIVLPHRELLLSDSTFLQAAQAWQFDLPAGRELLLTQKGHSNVFLEIYDRSGKLLTATTPKTDSVVLEVKTGFDERLTVVAQTPPGTALDREFFFHSRASLHFPVAHRDETAIKSFWGDRRDGGRRKHKGNDVFAPKGTPLLAVADGRVTRVRNGGLGGKTVWLRDGEGRPYNYYYAHLDSQLVRPGQRVRRGDTLGTVGNTGNARTTPPHLHFGIYQPGGARDPFPFLKNPDREPPRPRSDFEAGSQRSIDAREPYYLRRRASQREEAILRQLDVGEDVLLLGKAGRFARVRTRRGELGYVAF